MNAEASQVDSDAQSDDSGAASTEVKKAKAPPEKVTMTDGRVVEFAGKRELVKSYDVDTENATVALRLDFRNGQTRKIFPHPALILQFAGHGMAQKYGDELADPKLTDIDDKVAAIDQLDEQLQSGEWSSRAPGDSMAGTSVLLKALVEVSKKDGETDEAAVSRVREFLKTKKQPEKMALRNSARIKPVVDRIEAEKAAKGAKVDTDALLAELG